MAYVIVLTAAGPIAPAVIEATRRSFRGGGVRQLAENAVEFPAEKAVPEALDAARAALSGAPVDLNAVPAANRQKKLLICDMDSTIIGCECIDEIADFAGVGTRVAAITERAMRGELDFEAALRERVGLLRGLPAALLQDVYDSRVHLNSGAADMVAGMKSRGAFAALISGGFLFFTERVAAAAGFDHHQANDLLVADGRLTGEPGSPILGKAAKREALMRFCAERGIGPEDAVAVGDGANDLAMIGAAGLGVAYRAKPAVAAAADARLDHSDLTAVLRLQGIPAPGFS